MSKCEICPEGEGWLLQENDVYGLQIEKCDSCDRFNTDKDAEEFAIWESSAYIRLLQETKASK